MYPQPRPDPECLYSNTTHLLVFPSVQPANVIITSREPLKHSLDSCGINLPGLAGDSTRIDVNVFTLLEANGIPTHFLGRYGLDGRFFEAVYVTALPISLLVTRRVTASYQSRHPDTELDAELAEPDIEIFEKRQPNIPDREEVRLNQQKIKPLIEFDYETGEVKKFYRSRPRNSRPFEAIKIRPSRFKPVKPAVLTEAKGLALKSFLALEQAWQQLGGVISDLLVEVGFTEDVSPRLVVADSFGNYGWTIRFPGDRLGKLPVMDILSALDKKADTSEIGKMNRFVALRSDKLSESLVAV